MISPREAWLEHRVKYLEDELRRATGQREPSRIGCYENPIDLTVKDFRATENSQCNSRTMPRKQTKSTKRVLTHEATQRATRSH